jgi:1,4-dihydroxy-2-naphthoate octaprenyltransferase
VIATAASIAATWYVQRTQRWWAALTSLLLAIAVVIGFAAVIFTNRLIRHDHAAI